MGHWPKINILILFYIAYSLKLIICIVRLPYLLPYLCHIYVRFATIRLLPLVHQFIDPDQINQNYQDHVHQVYM